MVNHSRIFAKITFKWGHEELETIETTKQTIKIITHLKKTKKEKLPILSKTRILFSALLGNRTDWARNDQKMSSQVKAKMHLLGLL